MPPALMLQINLCPSVPVPKEYYRVITAKEGDASLIDMSPSSRDDRVRLAVPPSHGIFMFAVRTPKREYFLAVYSGFYVSIIYLAFLHHCARCSPCLHAG